MEASITISTKSDDKLRHNEDVAGQVFKYDLPIENLPISFKNAAKVPHLWNKIVFSLEKLQYFF